MSDNLKKLQDGEAKAMQLRNDYKDLLSKKPPVEWNKIIFPAIHISEWDDMLRYGMCWLYNWFMIITPEHGLLVDPGVDFSYRWMKSWYPISRCDTMYITHQHIDHVWWAPTYLEWLLRGRKMINIMLTPETIEDGNIPKYYLWSSPERASHNVTLLDAEKEIDCWPYKLQTIQHFHGAVCYGFSTVINDKKISHISDTWYATKVRDSEWEKLVWKEKVIWAPLEILEKRESLRNAIHWSDTVIINMEVMDYAKNSYTHATAYDIIDMVKDNDIKNLIISHINPCGQYTLEWMKDLQEFVQEQSWVTTIIPGRDGLEYQF